RRQHVDAETTVDAGDLILAAIDPAAGLADPLEIRDHPLHAGAVLEVHPQQALLPVVATLVVRDVALVLEDAADLGLELAGGHVHFEQLGPDRVADPGQHVSDRVGHVHRDLPSDLPARLDHAGDVTGEGELAETDTAQLELAQVTPRAPALAAARVA